jgi:hypothetical protein
LGDQVVAVVRAKFLTLGRFAVAASAIVAWFVISNHCVLGAVQRSGTFSDAHLHCPAHQAPTKQQHEGDMPCCKTLKATAAAKTSAKTNAMDFVLMEYFSGRSAPEFSRTHTQTLGLDTGPPGALSFSESVLQRSILAHAPPASLS